MKKNRNIFTACLCLSFILLGFSNTVESEEVVGYKEFYQEQKSNLYLGEDINVLINEKISIENQQKVTLNVKVPESGLYYPSIIYSSENDSVLPAELELKVNGLRQYNQLANLNFRANWKRSPNIGLDRYGNEIVGEVTKEKMNIENYFYDSDGFLDQPLAIFLNKGENEIVFSSVEGELVINEMNLVSEKNISALNVTEDPSGEVSGNNKVVVQAEFPHEQNASSIRPGATFDYKIEPYDSKKRVLNHLDSASFYSNHDKVTYELEVPESGYYYLSMNYRQDSRIDFPVFMNIFIDDEIPSESYFRQGIPYSTKFTYHTISKENNPIPVYVEKGKHSVTLQITGEPVAKVFYGVSNIISEVQQLSLQVTDLLGGTMDRNRDVNIEEYLPNTKEKLLEWAEELQELSQYVTLLSQEDKLPGAYTQLELAERQLRNLAKDYRYFANRYDELTTVVTSNLSTLLQDSVKTGISIDEIILHQSPLTNKSDNILKKIKNSVDRFAHSFKNTDYEVKVDSNNLQVWVNRPRQYVEILQKNIDQQFTAKTGIKVDISIMPDQNKLILANASGTSPDVALGVNSTLPFDMGIRNALQDISQMDGFENLQKTVPKNLFIPYTVGDEVYAFPETMNFFVLFYRHDILNSLNLEVPNTLEDLVNILPALNQQGMSAFYPTAINGFKGFPLTMPVIYQDGGDFYTDDILKTGISQEKTIESLNYLTDLFTIYNLPKEVPSFYQQFRDGSIPLGISDYNTYNMILNAAPEIANLWDITVIPGIEDQNGEVHRYSSGAAESSILFKSSNLKEEAWEFMKWWHSAETQSDFGIDLQTTNGKEYIWNTANLEAFAQLPFTTKHKQVILEQAKWITEVPRTISSYMVEREVNAIYNGVVIDGKNLRRLTDRSSKTIDRETMRKLEEFGYYSNNEELIPYPTLPEVKNYGNN